MEAVGATARSAAAAAPISRAWTRRAPHPRAALARELQVGVHHEPHELALTVGTGTGSRSLPDQPLEQRGHCPSGGDYLAVR